MNTPRIKPIFSIVAHSPDCVELRAGIWNAFAHVVQDDSKSGNLLNIVKSLNSEITIPEIAKKNNVKRSEVEGIIDQLTQLGAIEFEPTTALDHYINNFNMTLKKYSLEKGFKYPVILLGNNEITHEIAKILSHDIPPENLKISSEQDDFFALCNNLDPKLFHDGLEFEKILTKFEPWKNNFIVFTQPHVNPIACNYLNRICYTLGIPWMHVAIDGPFLFIGPIFTGKEGPCYDCFETRILMNIKQQESYLRYKEALANGAVIYNGAPLHKVISALIASHASIEILNYCLTESSFTVRKALSIYLPIMEMSYNEVLQLSGCETCGSIAKRDDQQLYFDVQAILE